MSLVLSGGYEDDVDNGDEFTYTGSGGRELKGEKALLRLWMGTRAVLWIGIVLNSVADPGWLSWIPDPTFFHPGSEFFPSRIRIKEFKYFNSKNVFLSSTNYDPDCSSWIRISDPNPDFLPIPDPGSKGQKGIGFRFRNTGFDADPDSIFSFGADQKHRFQYNQK
jgi:hypothetical protein